MTRQTADKDHLKAIPEITEEEDKPFNPGKIPWRRVIELRDQMHYHDIENFKHFFAKRIIYICFIGISVFAVLDAFFNFQSEIFKNGFEIYKLITMAALGYIFGIKQ